MRYAEHVCTKLKLKIYHQRSRQCAWQIYYETMRSSIKLWSRVHQTTNPWTENIHSHSRTNSCFFSFFLVYSLTHRHTQHTLTLIRKKLYVNCDSILVPFGYVVFLPTFNWNRPIDSRQFCILFFFSHDVTDGSLDINLKILVLHFTHFKCTSYLCLVAFSSRIFRYHSIFQ